VFGFGEDHVDRDELPEVGQPGCSPHWRRYERGERELPCSKRSS
jgi:hypothetical protein